jgi:mannose-6-phosphate isomerase-like protein (cupin superfamily)
MTAQRRCSSRPRELIADPATFDLARATEHQHPSRQKARISLGRSGNSARVRASTVSSEKARDCALLRTCQTVDEQTSRTRLDPESPERFVSLRRALGVTTFGINQMVLQPGQRMRIHRHQRQEEVYVVLEGRLTVAVEAQETELGAGELMRVAPQVRRQLVNRGPGRVLLIALGADGDHEGRDAEAFTSWDETTGASPREVPLPDDLDSQELRS